MATPSSMANVSLERVDGEPAAEFRRREEVSKGEADLVWLSDAFPPSHYIDPVRRTTESEKIELVQKTWSIKDLKYTIDRLEKQLLVLGNRLGKAGTKEFNIKTYVPKKYRDMETYDEWKPPVALRTLIADVWEAVEKFQNECKQQQQQQLLRPNETGASEKGGKSQTPVKLVPFGTAKITKTLGDFWPTVDGNKKKEMADLTPNDTEMMAVDIANAIQNVCHTAERTELINQLSTAGEAKMASMGGELKKRMDKLCNDAKKIDHKRATEQVVDELEELIEGLSNCSDSLALFEEQAAKAPMKTMSLTTPISSQIDQSTPKHTDPHERVKSADGIQSVDRPREIESSNKSQWGKTPMGFFGEHPIPKKVLFDGGNDGSGPGVPFPQSQSTPLIPVATTVYSSETSATATPTITTTITTTTVPNIARSELDDKLDEVERLRQTVEQQKVDLQRAHRQVEAIQFKMAELQKQLDMSETKVGLIKEQLELNQLDNDKKQKTINSLESQLQQLKTELSSTKEELQLEQMEVQTLTAKAVDSDARWNIVTEEMNDTGVHLSQLVSGRQKILSVLPPPAQYLIGTRKRPYSHPRAADESNSSGDDNAYTHGDYNPNEKSEDEATAPRSSKNVPVSNELDQIETPQVKKQKLEDDNVKESQPPGGCSQLSTTKPPKVQTFAFDFNIEVPDDELKERLLGKRPHGMNDQEWAVKKDETYAAKLQNLETVGVRFSDQKTKKDLRYMCPPAECNSFIVKSRTIQEHRTGRRLTSDRLKAACLKVHEQTMQIPPIVVLPEYEKFLVKFYLPKQQKSEEGKFRGLNTTKVKDMPYAHRDIIITGFTICCEKFRMKHSAKFVGGKDHASTDSAAASAVGSDEELD